MHRRQVDEQSSTGASTRVVPLQRSGFIGPLTLQDMILSSKWKVVILFLVLLGHHLVLSDQ